MDSGSLVVCIGDRDGLPVRAIPFVTGWKVSPDVVAKRLARQGNFGPGQGLGGALLPAGKVGVTTPLARHQARLLPWSIAAVVSMALNRAGTAPHHARAPVVGAG